MGWGEVILQIPWDAWIKPLLVWSCFILLCYFVMICMVNILSRQALYNERMNFPLLQVPQLMEEVLDKNGLEGFLTHRFFLIGLLIPLCLHLLNGLSFYFPAVPQIPTLILAGSYFPGQGLFSGFHNLKIYLYPAFIGFAFLTSKQISFSFWFCFAGGSPADRFAECSGIHHSRRGSWCDIRSHPFPARRDPGDRGLRDFFSLSALAGPFPFPGRVTQSLPFRKRRREPKRGGFRSGFPFGALSSGRSGF